MQLFNILPAFVSLLAIVFAKPVISDASCDPISKYTPEWFLENTKPEWRRRALDSTALFYSSGLSARAKQVARQTNKVTIWEVWPCASYHIKPTRSNPLHCIMSSIADELTYFENMSTAFAMMAHNAAWVMHRNIEDPPMTSIWGRKELPVLQARGGTVDYIIAVDANDLGKSAYAWVRDVPGRIFEEGKALMQHVLWGRDLEEEDVEKRGVDACPIDVRETHPLF